VLLIDGDDQGTALAFTDLRTTEQGNPGYTAVALHGANIRTQVRQLATKYSDILIDVGGRDTGSLFRRGLPAPSISPTAPLDSLVYRLDFV
jgi:chromosome partitioning protein